MTALVVVLSVLVAVLVLLVGGLLRSHAEILRRLADLGAQLDPDASAPAAAFLGMPAAAATAVGGSATELVGVSPSGEALALSVHGDQDTLLAFLTTGCLSCQGFWSAFAGPLGLPARVRLVVVTQGVDRESPAQVAQLAPPQVTVVMSTQAWDDYGVPGAPYFVHVEASGRVVGEGQAGTWEQVRSMFDQAGQDRGAIPPRGPDARLAGASQDRADRVDAELRAAGLHPGDPRLRPGAAQTPVPRP